MRLRFVAMRRRRRVARSTCGRRSARRSPRLDRRGEQHDERDELGPVRRNERAERDDDDGGRARDDARPHAERGGGRAHRDGRPDADERVNADDRLARDRLRARRRRGLFRPRYDKIL